MNPPLSPYLESLNRTLRAINRRQSDYLRRPSFTCADCRTVGDEGFVSDPLAQKVRCGSCARAYDRRALAAYAERDGAA